MQAFWRRFAIVIGVGLMACTSREEACVVDAESAELELIATRRFNARLERSFPEPRTDTVLITLSRDSIARDTVFGSASGRLSDLGVDVGPDTLDLRPYFAFCRGDSVIMTLDPRIVDKELWIRGSRSRPVRGAWSTAGFPQVEGEFRLNPRL